MWQKLFIPVELLGLSNFVELPQDLSVIVLSEIENTLCVKQTITEH